MKMNIELRTPDMIIQGPVSHVKENWKSNVKRRDCSQQEKIKAEW